MRVLLDTHIFLWLNLEPEKLSPAVSAILKNPVNKLCIGLASFWEIRIKQQADKLELQVPWREMLKIQ